MLSPEKKLFSREMSLCRRCRPLMLVGVAALALTVGVIFTVSRGAQERADVTSGLFPSGVEKRAKPKLGPLPSQSCSCAGFSMTGQNVPVVEQEATRTRRSEELRQYHIRKGTDKDFLIFASSNSPLQFPIQGVTVSPLKKSKIPGLALNAQKQGQYKVSLSVKSGVLSVEKLLEGEQVVGQDQRNLTISSSNLTRLNQLLTRVTYTSSIYHVRTSDLVYFCFEEHEAIFPIAIKRPSIPVLYDSGKDINSQVTITTKTFLRYQELNVLLKSIRTFYPDIKIIVADDSLQPEKVSGRNLEHYIMPPAQGWFAGRNLAVSQVTTKYFLWVDDDYVFNNDTRIETFVDVMEKLPELDVVGGAVGKSTFSFLLEYEEGDEEEGGCVRRIYKRKHQAVAGFRGCFYVDGIVNFFLARTDAVRRVGFDPFLKRVAHTEFFLDGLGDLLIASCQQPSVGHQKKGQQNRYKSFRFPGQDEGKRKMAHHYFKNHLKCIKY